MLHARHHLLADVAALVEIDAVELVHVGLVREGVAVDEIEPAARHAERDAVRLVGGGLDQLRRRDRPRPPWPDAAAACTRWPSAGSRGSAIDQAVFGRRRSPSQTAITPSTSDRSSTDHLGAQLVEIELLDERRRERARAIEEEAAAVLGRRLGDDEIDDDLALRRQQRGEARLRRASPWSMSVVSSPLRKVARVGAGDLDHAAVGEKCRFHAIPCCLARNVSR